MKKLKRLSFIISTVIVSLTIACSTSRGFENYKGQTIDKIDSLQRIIGFNDEQASKLKKIEMWYFQRLQRIKKCTSCNVNAKKMELEKDREVKLKEILNHSQYLKYDAIENDRIIKGEIRVE